MKKTILEQQLSRRFFLQGTGAVIALPFFASLLPRGARAATGGPPVRYMSYFVPLGMMMDAWTPTGEGANYTLSPTLKPLAALQKHFTVLSGTNNDVPNQPTEPGGHARGTGAYNTASNIVAPNQPAKTATTADQMVAQSIGKNTRLSSLQLGLDDITTQDGQFSSNYNGSISWSSPTTNLPPQQSASAVFKRLFPDGKVANSGVQAATSKSVASQSNVQRSILDAAVSQAQSLQKKLGVQDGRRLDQYLTGIREVEQAIAGPATGGSSGVDISACVVPDAPNDALDLDKEFDQWAQLMTLAFQCDQTRVISFMYGAGESYRTYRNLGISAGHHPISHYRSGESGMSQDAAIAALKKIQVYEMECFARLLTRMQGVTESNGSLLDNSVILFSSELTDSDRHTVDNMPVLLAGGGGGSIKSQGQHLKAAGATDYAQILLASMRAAGLNIDKFGNRGETNSFPGVLG